MRWSAIFTLATKHKSSASKIIYKYSRDLKIYDDERNTLARLPGKSYFEKVGRRFLLDIERGRVEKILKNPPVPLPQKFSHAKHVPRTIIDYPDRIRAVVSRLTSTEIRGKIPPERH